MPSGLCEVLMKLVRGELSKRRFEAFIADAADVLSRTGYLMTGDSGTAEDLVQETFYPSRPAVGPDAVDGSPAGLCPAGAGQSGRGRG
jgi:hypothetical protein